MPITYAAAAKDARLNGIRGLVGGGSVEILTSADAVLVTHTLDGTAGSVTSGVWTLGFASASSNASGTGTAAKAQIKTSGGTAVITGLTVGTSGTDITINDTAINSGQTISAGSISITHG